jgi:hypothetical protein
MAQFMTCPDAEMFQKLLRGEASAEQLEAFADHLTHCSACAAAVDKALASDTLAQAVRGQAAGGEAPVPPEELLKRLLQICRQHAQQSASPDLTADYSEADSSAGDNVSLDFLAPQIILRITDKQGKTREIELKPGDRIEIVEKPAPVETPPKPTPDVKIITGDPDRRPCCRDAEGIAKARGDHEHLAGRGRDGLVKATPA